MSTSKELLMSTLAWQRQQFKPLHGAVQNRNPCDFPRTAIDQPTLHAELCIQLLPLHHLCHAWCFRLVSHLDAGPRVKFWQAKGVSLSKSRPLKAPEVGQLHSSDFGVLFCGLRGWSQCDKRPEYLTIILFVFMELLKTPRARRVSSQFLWKVTIRVKCTSSNTHCLQGKSKQLHLRWSASLPLYSVEGSTHNSPGLSQADTSGRDETLQIKASTAGSDHRVCTKN